ncbi:major tail protein [Sutcliffiella horikoshii]|uniref:major tail protein n=1 Tax=Sutcliffiella horikoshii TaxID=79883 RepID=UPI003CF53833
MEKMSSITGLQNGHFALMTSDDELGAVYETPERFAPLVTATVTTNVETATQYSDNQAQETANAVGITEVNIEAKDIPNSMLAKINGLTKNSDGVLEFSSDYNAPYLAFLFEGTKGNGAKRMVALLKGKANIPEDAFETKGEGAPVFQSKTLTLTFIPRNFDKKFKFVVDSDDEGVNQAVIDGWYDAVYAGPVAP